MGHTPEYPSRRQALPPSLARYIPLAVTLGIGIVGTAILAAAVSEWEDRQSQAAFRNAAEDRAADLRTALEPHLFLLQSVVSFYAGSEEVTRSEFREFAKPALARFGGLQAIEWIPRVRHDERAAYDAAARKDGFHAYDIAERSPEGRLVPAQDRDEYFPVFFVEPYVGNERALGYDVASDAVRQEALARARDTGEAAASGRILLVQETGNQWGFLVFQPVYRKGAPLATVEDRRAALEGFALAVFRTGDLVRSAVGPYPPSGIDTSLYDCSAAPEVSLLCSLPSRTRRAADGSAPAGPDDAPAGGLSHGVTFDVAGRQWQIVCSAAPAWLAGHRLWYSETVLAGGLGLTALLGTYFLFSIVRTTRIRRLAALLLDANAQLTTQGEQLVGTNEQLRQEVINRLRVEADLKAAEHKCRMIVEKVPAVTYMAALDEAKTALYVSPQVERMTGFGAQDFKDDPAFWTKLIHPDDRERVLAVFTKQQQTGEPFGMEHRIITRDGGVLWVRDEATVVTDSAGQPGYLLGIVTDITEHRKADEALKESERRFRELAELLPETVFELDVEGRVTFANHSGLAQFGYSQEDVEKGLNAADTTVPERRDRFRSDLQRVMAGEDIGTMEYVGLRKDASTFQAHVYAGPIRRNGGVTGVRGILVDVSAQKVADRQLAEANAGLEAANCRLEELATTDPLTGLSNRRRFLEVLEAEVERARRYGTGLALMMIDIDQFKQLNDTCGHAFGDHILTEVAACLRQETRQTDIVARYAGDEFMVLMPNTSAGEAISGAERIRKTIGGHPIISEQRCAQVTISTGIGVLGPALGMTPEGLIRSADEALYAAKHAGRNCVRSWDQLCHNDRAESLVNGDAIAAMERKLADLSVRSQDVLIESVQSLIQALDARDPYTRSHSENVTRYAVGIAEAMGLDAEEMAVIRRAAMVHDIGKIGVPDAILQKAGPLAPEERDVMQQHPLIGVRILDSIRLLQREIPIVRHHHERWDGAGYPDGLQDAAIPIGARILAVADAFDAITSDRVYREGVPADDALDRLAEESGRQFDPAAVDALLKWIRAAAPIRHESKTVFNPR